MIASIRPYESPSAYTHSRYEPSPAFDSRISFGRDELSSQRLEWERVVDELRRFRDFEDDWDGLGAIAPDKSLVDSAIRLAQNLSSQNPCPSNVVVGVNGTISFEWNANLAYAELEIVAPGEFELRCFDRESGSMKSEYIHFV